VALGKPWRLRRTTRRHWTAVKSARGGGGARERAGRRRVEAGREQAVLRPLKAGAAAGAWRRGCCGVDRLPRNVRANLGRRLAGGQATDRHAERDGGTAR
jgi:hypothetical protein